MRREVLSPNKIEKLLSNDTLMQSCRDDYNKLQIVIGNILSLRDNLIALKMDYTTLYKEYIKLKKTQKKQQKKRLRDDGS